MCGIVGGFTRSIERGVGALLHRGPDAQGMMQVGSIALGHTRLSIIDLDSRSDQPFLYGDVRLVFNGELWNYRELREELRALGCTFQTDGDTEVIAAAINTWGVDALPRLNGMFALGWTQDGETLYLARDRFGEVPLHIAFQRPFYFASELKALLALGAHPKSFQDVEAGSYLKVTHKGVQRYRYYDIPLEVSDDDRDAASQRVREGIQVGALERTISDVPVCTMLSGGIDSAAIAYFLAQKFPNLVAYTAVYNERSRDLRSARLVADTLGIELREVKVALPSADDLSRVIEVIEMPHKAQIEIGYACLKVAEAMRSDGFKVTFSGEGSDELWGSYGFAYYALQTQDWHSYRKDLFLTQQRKNFMRCNKVFMAHGIECRLPFLNTGLVEYAISLRQSVVQEGKTRPKAVMQDAFLGLLPDEITRRPKVAFQDGMGLKQAIAGVLTDAKRYYRAEHDRLYARQRVP